MSQTAPTQVDRIVHLVAWMSQRDMAKPVSYSLAAKLLRVPEKTIRQDLDTLVRLTDEYKEWFSSLSLAFTATGFTLTSPGHFRRPFHLTADESLVLLLGLANTRGGQGLASQLGAVLAKGRNFAQAAATVSLGPTPSEHADEILGVTREAIATGRKLEINYCGSNGEAAQRTVCPHQVVQRQVWWYMVAWCEKVSEYRHFRVDRVLGATLLDGRYTPRPDFKPIEKSEDVFRGKATISATVAFSPRIARWIKEKYPSSRKQADGRYVATFQVADPAWFVREVLQYGAEAEVLAPTGLREVVRAVVQGPERAK